MGQPAADPGIHQRAPEHIAGNGHAKDFKAARNAPENDRERHQADDVGQQPEPQGQGVAGEAVEVFTQALVGVIGVAALLQLIKILVLQPAREVLLGQPAPPADGQHLGQVQAVHRREDRDGGNAAEIQHQVGKGGQVLVLQGIVEVAVPAVDGHRNADIEQRQGDDHDQQQPGLAPLFAAPVGRDQPPDPAPELAADLIVDRRVFSVQFHDSDSTA
ncbi:hypothetical protein D3C85_1067840 [compost metagenome]